MAGCRSSHHLQYPNVAGVILGRGSTDWMLSRNLKRRWKSNNRDRNICGLAGLKWWPTWAGFKGSHAVSDALFVAGAETHSVTQSSGDVSAAKRHHLQHLLEPRLQLGQQLLQCPACFHLGANTHQSRAPLSNIHIHILSKSGVKVNNGYCIIFVLKTVPHRETWMKTVFTSGSREDDSGITYTTKEPHKLSLSVCNDRSAAKGEV